MGKPRYLRTTAAADRNSTGTGLSRGHRLALGLLLCVAFAAGPAHAIDFDDLEKIEKLEKKERDARRAREEAARREEQARRLAQQQAEEAARQRAASSGGNHNSGGGSSGEAGGRYSVYKDKGRAAAWEWFKQEVVVKCEGGRKNGDLPSVYLEGSGRWSTTYAGKFDSFQAAATAACQ